MFESGIFPSPLKTARVTVIHKSGDKDNISNYRPISILPILSKVFENLINNRIRNFLTSFSALSPAQYGFQKGKSTEHALLHIKDKILNNFENKLLTLGVYLDFRKAFDSINHDVLLQKLPHYGIRGKALDLIGSFLQNRGQYVQINGICSDHMTLKYGVPQGSILGPLLFIIYLNDIVNIANSPSLIMYADDTSLFFSGTTIDVIERDANNYLRTLNSWLEANKMQLNSKKTKYMLFRAKNKKIARPPCLKINDCTIEQISDCKFLGVWFNDQLSWTTQTMNIKKELSRAVGAIYKTRDILPTWLKVQLYYTLFYQKLYYCFLVWGTTCKTNYKGLISLQQRIIRIVANAKYDSNANELFEKLNILPLNTLYHYKLGQLVHAKGINSFDLTPSNLTDYNLRAKSAYKLPRTRTNYGNQKINFQVPQLLNALGDNVPLAGTTGAFKRQLRSFLVKHEIRIM